MQGWNGVVQNYEPLTNGLEEFEIDGKMWQYYAVIWFEWDAKTATWNTVKGVIMKMPSRETTEQGYAGVYTPFHLAQDYSKGELAPGFPVNTGTKFVRVYAWSGEWKKSVDFSNYKTS